MAQYFTNGAIVNLYGSTETTLAKCYYQIPQQISPGIQPVGFPLPHTQALVLNSKNNLCGIGEVGEIVIRTPFRSLGYINANKEQQKRFIKNPHTAIENDLLYFTGDRGRYLSNGSLQILGRIDRQVKIRGVRIELGEIESILTTYPDVKQAVVTVKDDLLIGYLVTKKDISVDRIRDYLKQRLPEYTIPSVLVRLENLPLNANGKVDRNALPTPVIENKTPISPKTPTQEIIANIFATVLNLESVGIEDNFFALGGHSLLATQVISRLRQHFKIDIPLRTLFEYPTVAKLETV
ncbi:phosphopantetheine-binding protein, partial [Anaplasma marginale]|uniref:phosphopantetheine-binding protein n=1 Tax=Anaplasma marginale TaxID=770 RepID=UPI0011454A7F